jgi:glutamate-5-semialdehyde dehydrogenase
MRRHAPKDTDSMKLKLIGSDPTINLAALADLCRGMAVGARAAATVLATVPTERKNAWLRASADRLQMRSGEILAANARDVSAAPGYGLTAAQIDRLALTPSRVAAAAEGLRQVAALPDPVGEVREGGTRPNGLQVLKVGVPLGVIFFLYESRPNVTVDAAGLAVKSGNAVILRGGKESLHSNAAIHAILANELTAQGLPREAVQFVSTTERDAVGYFLRMNDLIDLTIPRGGEGLIRRVAAEATMPVLKHYIGNCHVYVDRAADLDMAERIVINSKTQRTGVCNAAESLLVHAGVANLFVKRIVEALRAKKVEVRGCAETRSFVPDVIPATEEDYAAEYLDLVISMKIVSSLGAAISHINKYGSKHTDAIVTNDLAASRAFASEVDSAAVMVNASTRFNDGFELGLGAEIGISTDKFHARGPCGLRELTTYKYIVTGDGHVRN